MVCPDYNGINVFDTVWYDDVIYDEYTFWCMKLFLWSQRRIFCDVWVYADDDCFRPGIWWWADMDGSPSVSILYSGNLLYYHQMRDNMHIYPALLLYRHTCAGVFSALHALLHAATRWNMQRQQSTATARVTTRVAVDPASYQAGSTHNGASGATRHSRSIWACGCGYLCAACAPRRRVTPGWPWHIAPCSCTDGLVPYNAIITKHDNIYRTNSKQNVFA